MRKIQLLIILLFVPRLVCGQTEIKQCQEFLKKQFGTHYTDLGTFDDSIFKNDFSKIWTTTKINVDPKETSPYRPEPIGFIGENYQRLYIHFLNVVKRRPKCYFVNGKSKVNSNICDFNGIITIEQARQFTTPYNKDDGNYIDSRIITQGILTGQYALIEDSTQLNSGEYKGTFILSFYITKSGEIFYNTRDYLSDNYINIQFSGTWKSYSTRELKIANWGDYRIPESGDLDVGAAFFSPADKYLKYGWQLYRDAILSKEYRVKEQQKWWK
jgi:hypothetical protein